MERNWIRISFSTIILVILHRDVICTEMACECAEYGVRFCKYEYGVTTAAYYQCETCYGISNEYQCQTRGLSSLGITDCIDHCTTTGRDNRCPRIPVGTTGLCHHECSSEYDCADSEMCCSNGCGHTCMSRGTPTTQPPPDRCPRIPAGTAGLCHHECSSDYDCADSEKCCSNGCGHTCMSVKQPTTTQPPIIVRPPPDFGDTQHEDAPCVDIGNDLGAKVQCHDDEYGPRMLLIEDAWIQFYTNSACNARACSMSILDWPVVQDCQLRGQCGLRIASTDRIPARCTSDYYNARPSKKSILIRYRCIPGDLDAVSSMMGNACDNCEGPEPEAESPEPEYESPDDSSSTEDSEWHDRSTLGEMSGEDSDEISNSEVDVDWKDWSDFYTEETDADDMSPYVDPMQDWSLWRSPPWDDPTEQNWSPWIESPWTDSTGPNMGTGNIRPGEIGGIVDGALRPGGVLATGGINFPTGGINIPTGGINLPTGGINLPTGGINIPTGGINIPDGTIGNVGGRYPSNGKRRRRSTIDQEINEALVSEELTQRRRVKREAPPLPNSLTFHNPSQPSVGYLVSPNYPDSYPNNIKAQCLLHTVPGATITLKVGQFQLASQPCDSDWVTLTYESSQMTLCGSLETGIERNFFSDWLKLQLHTDDDDESHPGFILAYWAVDWLGNMQQVAALCGPDEEVENYVEELKGPEWSGETFSSAFTGAIVVGILVAGAVIIGAVIIVIAIVCTRRRGSSPSAGTVIHHAVQPESVHVVTGNKPGYQPGGVYDNNYEHLGQGGAAGGPALYPSLQTDLQKGPLPPPPSQPSAPPPEYTPYVYDNSGRNANTPGRINMATSVPAPVSHSNPGYSQHPEPDVISGGQYMDPADMISGPGGEYMDPVNAVGATTRPESNVYMEISN